MPRPWPPPRNACVEEIEDAGAFRLISLEALVRMKLSAFRDKDRMHLRNLLSVGLLDESWKPRLADPLRIRLEELLASPEDWGGRSALGAAGPRETLENKPPESRPARTGLA
jgi:hypothetical protein